MTEEKKLIVGLQNMRKRLISAAQYLEKQGDKAGMDRCGRDCRLIEKAVKAIEGPKTRLMPVKEVLENPETLIWLEHYRYIAIAVTWEHGRRRDDRPVPSRSIPAPASEKHLPRLRLRLG